MNLKIAETLQKHRKQHAYSQEELADKLGVSRQAVSKWERGEASPDTDNLIALAKLYQLSLDQLIGEQIDENQQSVSLATQSQTQLAQTTTNSDKTDEEEVLSPRQKAILGIANGSAIMILSIIYLVLGFCCNLWHPAWIVFMLLPIIASFADAIVKKDAKHFAYPVLVSAIYVLIGFLTNLWHPCWILFLSIPLYYIIVDAIYSTKK